VAYVRTVKSSSGATAVQIVWSSRRGSRSIEHIGSAHDEAGLVVLKAAAAQRLAAGQAELDLGVVERSASEPLPITSSRAAQLWDALCRAYDMLGFDQAAGADDVFRQLVLARVIEPTSKADSLRAPDETGVAGPSYSTLNRRLPVYAKPVFRQSLSTVCATHSALGPASLVLYDVSTLHFETDAGDGFREPGFSKERRLDPQITIGLLTNSAMSRWSLMPARSSEKARGIPDRVVHYQYRHDRARRSLRGIDEQVAKAQRAVDGHAAVKQNRFIKLTGATKSVNRDLEAKTRAGGLEGIHHQPGRPEPGVRHRRIPPAVAHREGLPHVQARLGRPPDLPPHLRLHRRSPDDRVRRPSRVALDRDPNRLEHQEIRAHRTPLPHRHHPGRTATLTAAEPPPDDLAEALTKIHRTGAH
jgi:hypothetical protein